MKLIIKNPAPTDSRMKKWGDFHFGRSLGAAMQTLGWEVVTHYHSEWETKGDENADVVLVLRGRFPFPIPAERNSLYAVWNISHPSDVQDTEYEQYDLICVASRLHAESLASRLSAPVHALLQCANVSELDGPLVDAKRRDFVFVGNTRGVRRPAVQLASDAGLPLRIWGRGWESTDAEQHVVADYFPNENLGRLYRASRATFNDHWDDMAKFGFINNRVFDALVCGLPIVTDTHQELSDCLGEYVLEYSDKDSFSTCVERLMTRFPTELERARAGREFVRDEYSFKRRAERLDAWLREKLA